MGVASSLFPGNGIDAYKLMLGRTFANNFNIEYGYSYFDIVDAKKDLFEQNLIIDWKVLDNINLHMVATLGEHRDRPMNLYFIRIRYLFQ